MSKLGASPVSLPGGQIYENLVSGSIDATEWVGPYNDYFLKFYEAAKYYYTGGMHEPGSCLAMAFNGSFWGKLTDNEKALITAASMEEHAAQYEETCAKNGEYLATIQNNHVIPIIIELFEKKSIQGNNIVDCTEQHITFMEKVIIK